MNMLLKCLAAVALIAVTIAAATYVVRKSSGPTVPSRAPLATAGKDREDPTDPVPGRKEPPPPFIAKGGQPLVVAKDDRLQPSYRPINQPAFIQFLRQEGKTYESRVVGQLSGKASKKDWGFRGVANFEYIYAVESAGRIVRNDGVTIIEERAFSRVLENLLVTEYEVQVELPERLSTVLEFFGLRGAVDAVNWANSVRIPVKKEWVDTLREAGVFKDWPEIDPARYEKEIRLFAIGDDSKLLEGKKVRITFTDGQGVTGIEPVDCGLTQQERDIIVRTNFVLDHYIFPDREVGAGETWDVDGSVLGGFLDPRLRGKVGGKVAVVRTPDFIDANGRVSKRLKIAEGTIQVTDDQAATSVTGTISNLRGTCVLPDEVGVVTNASITCYAEYKKLSTDHLLFDAQMTMAPKTRIRYECSVK